MEKKESLDFVFTEDNDLDFEEDYVSSQTIDLGGLASKEVTESGSFDVRAYHETALGQLLNSLPMPALLLDRSGITLFANEASERIRPLNGVLKGEPFSDLFARPGRAAKALDLFHKVLVERHPQVGHTHIGAGERKIFGRIHLRSVRAWNERLILVVIEDLTAEKKQIILTKKHHELARQARDELEQRVRDRTAELLDTNRKLRREIAHRKRIEIQLRESENKYRTIFETAPVAIIEEDLSRLRADIQDLKTNGVKDFRRYINDHPEFVVNAAATTRILDMNEATLKLYGASDAADLVGPLDRIMVPDSLEILKEKIVALAEGTSPLETEAVDKTLQGDQINLLVRAALPTDVSHAKRSIIIKMDITELKQAQEGLARAKREWERTFDAVPDLVAIMDREQRIVRVNKAMASRLGAPARDLIGRRCFETFHASKHAPLLCPHKGLMADGREHLAEIVDDLLGGTFMVSVTPLLDDSGHVAGCVHVARDITERKRLEEELKLLATRDSLTGLLSRGHFMELLGLFFQNAKRYSFPLSLCLCDLDNFKEVNDMYGHQAGDRALEVFGEVLRHELRGSDLAGRYGGDEFVMIFPHTSASEACESLERIRAHVERIVLKSGTQSYSLTCTAGIAEFRPDMNTVEELVHNADKALYQGKSLGRNRVVLFEDY